MANVKKPKRAPRGAHMGDAGKPLPKAAWGALEAAYNRMPVFPYLDRITTLMLIACVAGYLGFTAYIFLTTPPMQIEARLSEGALGRNAQLGLLPGENYAYSLETQDGLQQVSYAVRSEPGCAGVVVAESSSRGAQEACILKNGMSPGSETASYLGNQSILLFSPWMLSASENFTWEVDTIYRSNGMEVSIPTYFSSKGMKKVAARDAYEIDISDSSGAAASRFYIDAEKRVLLYAELGNVTLKMASAPFALNWTAPVQN